MEQTSANSPPPPPPLPCLPGGSSVAIRLASNRMTPDGEYAVRVKNTEHCTKCRQKEMQFMLVGAIEKDDVSTTKSLIEEGVNLNAVILFTRTPLVHALEQGSTEVAILLIRKGADVHMTEQTFPSRKPVHFAARNGITCALEELFDQGADIHCEESTAMYPIHLAAWRGHVDAVNWLLQHGADVDVKDDFMRTPLHRAVEGNHIEVVQELLSAGADVNCKDRFNWTPLFHCIICDKVEMVNLLLASGIDVNTVSQSGDTPLHAACGRLRPVVTKVLLSSSADPIRRRRRIPYPAFEDELRLGGSTSKFEIIQSLIDSGAQLNARNNEGLSTLYLTLFFGRNLTVCKYLVDAGLDASREAWISEEWYRIRAVEEGLYDALLWLDAWRDTPLSLTKCCRSVIRHSIRWNIRRKVDNLPLPVRLRNFVNLEDFYSEFPNYT